MGIKVYVGAGNEGEKGNREFNTLSLANGVITVGALNADGSKAAISSDNMLVNRWARSVFAVTKTDNGIDFTGDGTTDIPYKELSSIEEGVANKQAKDSLLNVITEFIGATSVATAIALVEDFRK